MSLLTATAQDFLGIPAGSGAHVAPGRRSEKAPAQQERLSPETPLDTLGEALTRLAAGDRNALRTIYDESSGRLFAVCLRIVADRDAAEEVLQEVYLSVWGRAGQFDRGQGEALGWLIAIARNRAVDRVRSDRRRPQGSAVEFDAVPDPAPAADVAVERAQTAAAVRSRLAQLEPRAAWAIRTAFFEDVSYPELARRAGEPTGTIKSRVRRALLQLKASWSEDTAG